MDCTKGPQPGGCHGKSSRHNSYCRRLPCYNGSNYCKLHYRQYVTGQQAVTASTNSDTQDRRFMGNPGEVRCSATTTRGRACAYVAVRDTKYCFLHADYDTNPPPRRGASAFLRVSASASEATSKDIKKTKKQSDGTTASGDAATKPTPRRVKRKHIDSPFPLLSMISTDQWSHKRVCIATGPFKGRTGTVEKWGNGWVSVQILPGNNMHNRRSFELYLADEMEETSKVATSGLPESEDEASSLSSRDLRSPPLLTSSAAGHASAATVTPRSGPKDLVDTSRLSFVSPKPSTAKGATVTPLVGDRRTETMVPLVDSLLLSQEKSFLLDSSESQRSRLFKRPRHEGVSAEKRAHVVGASSSNEE